MRNILGNMSLDEILSGRDKINQDLLSIIDEGIGIVSKDLKRVFDPFFTGENGRKFGESTGMGLYLVKKVCDDLGHKVSIKSEVGKGTEVSISFNKDVNSLIKM